MVSFRSDTRKSRLTFQLSKVVPFTSPENAKTPEKSGVSTKMAEGVGFEPTDELPHHLISSQVPLTTQPPFRLIINMLQRNQAIHFLVVPRDRTVQLGKSYQTALITSRKSLLLLE